MVKTVSIIIPTAWPAILCFDNTTLKSVVNSLGLTRSVSVKVLNFLWLNFHVIIEFLQKWDLSSELWLQGNTALLVTLTNLTNHVQNVQ